MSNALVTDAQATSEVLKKPKHKPTPHLTRTESQKRDRRLIRIILKNPEMPHNEAMIQAGFSKKTANSQSKRTVERSRILTPIMQALEKAGINDDHLADKIKNGLECTKVISATVIHKDNNGKTEQMDDFIEVPDNPTQHRYVDTALKLKRSYPDPNVDLNITVPVQVNVVNYADNKGEK